MTTRDEVREVLRTLPDAYLHRYVEAFQGRLLSCFPGTRCLACAVTFMAGTNGTLAYIDGHAKFAAAGLDSRTIELFYEQDDERRFSDDSADLPWGLNATLLYDECVLELARRAVPAVVEAVR